MIESTRQLIILQKNIIKIYRLSNGKNKITIAKILEAKLVNLEMIELGIMVVVLKELQLFDYFKNANNMFKEFSK